MDNVIITAPSQEADTLNHLFNWLIADASLRQAAQIVPLTGQANGPAGALKAIEVTLNDTAALPALGAVLASWFAAQSEPPAEIGFTRGDFTVTVFDADPEILDMLAELLDCPPSIFGQSTT